MSVRKVSIPIEDARPNSRKRRRVEAAESKRVKQKSVTKTNARKTGLNADSLSWKEVSMPDRLEDYEGFFGLEEVEDVEVVKDAATGKLSFSAITTSGPGTNEDSASEPLDGDLEESGNGDAEWLGFGDDDGPSEAAPAAQEVRKLNGKQPKQTEFSQKKKASSSVAENVDSSTDPLARIANDVADDERDMSAWQSLSLSPDTLASLRRLKFSGPTPIQQSSIPDILSGHDVIGKASTGSGKTLAFGIPILERFLELRNLPGQRKGIGEQKPLALILSPTRELAHQLDKHLSALCSNGIFDGPSIATLTGGLSLQKQQRLLKTAGIVIGTPGRLWEVISQGQGVIRALKQIQFLVIDEADRLLSEGHFQEMEEILNALDRNEEDGELNPKGETVGLTHETQRQTLVFSATFDRGLQRKLTSKITRGGDLMNAKESLEYLLSTVNFREEKPKFIDVNPTHQLATGLKEGLVECAGTEKDLYLYTLLLLHPNTRTLVFTNSISAVRRLTPFLQNLNLPALPLHSGMAQKARLRSVERFTSGKSQSCSILVATDVAARGLDIPNVQVVIHYHLPRAADMYVHRSGRSARAGLQGSSILICAPEEVAGVRRLVAKVHANSALASDAGAAKKHGFYIRTVDMDRRLVTRLKPRATLAKKLADTTVAKEKHHQEDDFLRAAAEELGVDYDSEELETQGAGRRGRGSGRKKKEREARGMSKAEIASMKAELKGLLAKRVNVGVSERYLTSGGVDVEELLRQQDAERGSTNEFLGPVHGLGLDEI